MRISARTITLLACTAVATACSGRTDTPATEQPRADTPPTSGTPTPAAPSTAAPPTPDELAAAQQIAEESAARSRAAIAGKTFEEFEKSVYKEPFEGGKYIVNG